MNTVLTILGMLTVGLLVGLHVLFVCCLLRREIPWWVGAVYVAILVAAWAGLT